MKRVVKLTLASALAVFFLFPNMWMIYQVTGEATGPVTYQIDIIPVGILQQTNITVKALAKVIGTLFLDDEGTPVTGADVSYEFVTARIDGTFADENAGVYRTQLWMEIDVQYEEVGETLNDTLDVRPLVSENENWVLKVQIENASTGVRNVRIIDYTFEGGQIHYDINSTFSSIRISGAAAASPHSYEVDLAGQLGFALEGHHSSIEPIKGAKISYQIPGTEFRGEITGTADGRYDIEFNETILLKIHPRITVSPETILVSTDGGPVRQTLLVTQEMALTYAKNITLTPTELMCQPGQFIPAQSITISESVFDLIGISQREVTIEANLPEDTPPGMYAGEINVKTSEKEVVVPLIICNRYISPSFVEDYVLNHVKEVQQATIDERMNIDMHKDGYTADRTIIQRAIDQIVVGQKRDGNFADTRITCMTVLALLEAEKLGYSFDRICIQNAIDWLVNKQTIRLHTATFDRYSPARLATPKKPISMYPDPLAYNILSEEGIEPWEKQALFISTLALAQVLNYTINRNLVQQAIDRLELECKVASSYGGVKISSWIIRSLVLAEVCCFTVNSTFVQQCIDLLMNHLERDLTGKLEGDPNAQLALMALVEADNSCFQVNQTIIQLVADYLDEKEVGIYYGLGLKVQGLVDAESSVYSVNRTLIQNSVDWLLNELRSERVSGMESMTSVVEGVVRAEDAGWANKLDWGLSRLQIKLENLVRYMQGTNMTGQTPNDEIKFYQEVALRLKEAIFQTRKLAYLVLHPEFSEATGEDVGSMEDILATALVVSEGRLAKLGGCVPAGKLEVPPRPVMYVSPTMISQTIPFGGVETDTIFVSNLGNLKMLNVSLHALGDINSWTAFDKNNFDIEIHEPAYVNASFSPPTPTGPVPEEDLLSLGKIIVNSTNDGGAEVKVEIRHLLFTPHPTPDYIPPEVPKIDPLLFEVSQKYGTIYVAVDFYDDPTVDQIEQLESIGVNFTGTGVPSPDFSLDAFIASDLLDELEQTDFVKRVWSYTGRGGSSLLDRSVSLIGGRVVSGFGYNGTGIPVAVIDTGIAHYHNDLLGSRILSEHDYTSDAGDTSTALDTIGHGTHVAGIIGGSGSIYRGLAPSVSFVILKFDSSSNDYIQSSTRTAMYDAYHNYDAIIQSNGWGWFIWRGDATDPICRLADSLVQDGAIIVVAGGNEGDRGTRSPGNAKNVITVGAITSVYDSQQGGPATITSFSSLGPTGDNRFKPDIVAPGSAVVSLSNTDLNGNGVLDDYVSMSGTSTATSHVSGIISILLQAYESVYGTDLDPATVKALLMSSAVDLGYRRNAQGAGMIEVTQALIWNKDLNYKTKVQNGKWVNIPIQVDDKMTKLTITVTWADPPAPNHNNIDAYLYDSELKEVDYSISVDETVERITINNPSTKGKTGTWQLGLYGRQVQGNQPVAVSVFPSYGSVEVMQCPDSVNRDDSFTVQVKVNQATPPPSIVSPIARDNVIPTRVTISLNNQLELNSGETCTKEVSADGIVSWSVKARQTGDALITVFVVSESGNDYVSKTVIISEPGGGGGGGCPVATASTGTSTSEGLDILRRFRDLSLQKNLPGQIFVQIYYRYGPRIAWSMIDRSELRTVVRTGFIEPIVATSELALGITSNKSLRSLVQLATFVTLVIFVVISIRIRVRQKHRQSSIA